MRQPGWRIALAALLLLLEAWPAAAEPLGTAFTYQGELRASDVLVESPHDFRFRLFDAQDAGVQIGPTIERTTVAVTDGLFTVALDFGAGQFAGDAQWLEVSVRAAGTLPYQTLAPRTAVTATPYALGAAAALANSVTGTSIIDGAIGGQDLAAGAIGVAQIDSAQVQRRVGAACATGSSIRAIAVDGTVSCQVDVDTDTDTGVNAVTTGGGSTGSIAGRTLSLGTDATVQRRSVAGAMDCPLGQYLRSVAQDGTPTCSADQVGSFSGWNLAGNAGTDPVANFVGTTDAVPLHLRSANQAVARYEALPSADTGFTANVVHGSPDNVVTGGVRGATIAGGGTPTGGEIGDTGGPNVVTDHFGTVGGGMENRAGDAAGTLDGSRLATVGGGVGNHASGRLSFVGGGSLNLASGVQSTVGGGAVNIASSSTATVSGGAFNEATGFQSTVGGGLGNRASGQYATVSGGNSNIAVGLASTVTGGDGNEAAGTGSFASAGEDNCAGGEYSWAGGLRAKVRPFNGYNALAGCSGIVGPSGGDLGTFVWADASSSDYVSTGSNQFLVRANGGAVFQRGTVPPVPRGQFNVVGGFSGIPQPASPAASTIATFENNSNNYVRLLAPDASERGLLFGDPIDQADGGIVYNGANAMQFRTNSNETRMTIGADGSLTLVSGTAIKAGGGPWAAPSDARLKRAIEPLTGALDALLALHGVSFEYAEPDGGVLQAGRHLGFVAQQVRAVFPDWVGESAEGYLTVGPSGFEALAVEALRQLRAEFADRDRAQAERLAVLEAQNAALRAELEAREAAHRDQRADQQRRLQALEARLPR